MRYYYDTEFTEDGKTIDLISIGMVRDDGREFYRECSEFEESKCNAWVKKNVLPKLGPKESRKTRAEIRQDLLDFIATDRSPRFVAYVAVYDHICLSQLFGDMSKLPPEYPHYSWDLKQRLEEMGNPKLPEQDNKGDHNALEDAKWLKGACEYLEKSFGLKIPINKKKTKSEGAMLQVDAKSTKALAMIAVKYQLFLLNPNAEKQNMLLSIDPPFNFPTAVDQVMKTSKFQDLQAVVVIGLEPQIDEYLKQVERLDVTEWLDFDCEQRKAAMKELAKSLNIECKEKLREPEGEEIVYGEDEEVTAKTKYPHDLPEQNREIWDAVPKQSDFKIGWDILKRRMKEITGSEALAAPKKKPKLKAIKNPYPKDLPPGNQKIWDDTPATRTDKFDLYVLEHQTEKIRVAAHSNFYEMYCAKLGVVPWSRTTVTEINDARITLKGYIIQGEEVARKVSDDLFEHLEHAGLIHKPRARKGACITRHASTNKYEISWQTPWVLKPEKGQSWLQITSFIKREFAKRYAFREMDNKKRLVTSFQKGTVLTELHIVRNDESTIDVFINHYLDEGQAGILTGWGIKGDPTKIERTMLDYCNRWKKSGKFPKIEKEDFD